MTRSLMAVAAAAVLLGTGYDPAVAQPYDEWDEEGRLKHEASVRASRKEQDAQHEAHMERLEALRAAEREKSRQASDDYQKLRNGIEPSTGRPLSRQRRRALDRLNFTFNQSQEDTGTAQEAPVTNNG